MNRPDWSRIEQDVDAAMIGAATEYHLMLLERHRRIAGLAESIRILNISRANLARSAERATASLRAFTEAWNAPQPWHN